MTIRIGIDKAARYRQFSDAINAERDRRIAAGFTFQGKRFDFDPDSVANITGAGATAGIAVAMGAVADDLRWVDRRVDFTWLAADNSHVPMDALTCFAFARAAMQHKQAHIFAARALKDMEPVPVDYTDDRYWPQPREAVGT